MDRRTYRCNGSVAHESLRGTVEGVDFVEGDMRLVAASVANLLTGPSGALDRQLVHGEGFCVLEEAGDFAFGFAVPSGFVGYVAVADLRDETEATHRVSTMGAHVYASRSIKTVPVMALPFGASVSAADQGDGFWRVADGYVPEQQIVPVAQLDMDTAATALRFLGVPYLWGGDSNFGIDCSGLVHAALCAAGRDCPRDSDQQEAFFAQADGRQRGDLVFWKGHVGILVDADTIVHANGHHMATTVEPLDVVVARILAVEGKEITSIRRPDGVLNVP
jgi:cell wall-associated NlpC family hydrolase